MSSLGRSSICQFLMIRVPPNNTDTHPSKVRQDIHTQPRARLTQASAHNVKGKYVRGQARAQLPHMLPEHISLNKFREERECEIGDRICAQMEIEFGHTNTKISTPHWPRKPTAALHRHVGMHTSV